MLLLAPFNSRYFSIIGIRYALIEMMGVQYADDMPTSTNISKRKTELSAINNNLKF
jgi:hypothetical protein